MAPRRKRVKVGDVLELRVGKHFAYLHYIGRHPDFGDAVLVSPRLYDRQVKPTEVFSDGYVAFYPAGAAVAQELVGVAGNFPPIAMPRRFRRWGAMSGDRVTTWIISDDSGEIVKSVLSKKDLQLPILGIWNHEYLIERIAEGWRPEHEGRDRES
jgi:hypothetical protein